MKGASFTFLIFLLIIGLAIAGIDFSVPEDYVETNVLEVQGTILVLGKDCKAIIAETSADNALSILLGKQGTIDVRPNTHDAFSQTLKTFNITLESIQIHRVEDGWFYSDAILVSENKQLKLDIKPSDAMALALRMEAPIYINQTLLNEVGEDIC